MKYKDKPTKRSFQMIGILISVLILVFGLIQCSKIPTEPDIVMSENKVSVSQEEITFKITGCVEGTHKTGARYKICMPPDPIPWNGILVVYAHGYVNPFPKRRPELRDDIVRGDIDSTISEILTKRKFAFATTSYYNNGLVEPWRGIKDLVGVVDKFKKKGGEPLLTFLVGVSEGGMLATLAVEQRPDVFNGGLAMCGPIGDFRMQINYFGDFRVVFDYFFANAIPAWPTWQPEDPYIPEDLMANWDTYWRPAIAAALLSSQVTAPLLVPWLLSVTQAPVDPGDPVNSAGNTILGLLWYNVFGTNDAIKKLRGQPFDNTGIIYSSPLMPPAALAALNAGVKRFRPDPKAIGEMDENYQTSGDLSVPLVTMHTALDEIIPAWHQERYFWKTGGWRHTPLLIPIYGHCNFTKGELLGAFKSLVDQFIVPQPITAATR